MIAWTNATAAAPTDQGAPWPVIVSFAIFAGALLSFAIAWIV